VIDIGPVNSAKANVTINNPTRALVSLTKDGSPRSTVSESLL
jgi:hypothetical protein